MNEPFIFVSYRRSDTTPYALALKAELEHRLHSAHVFVDIERTQTTDHWPGILNNTLTRSRVLILMIGPKWNECIDCEEHPKLFNTCNWVRKEVVYFLLNNPHSILPILVDDARMPPEHELPADMAEVLNIHALRLNTTHWQQGIDEICQCLVKKFAFHLSDPVPSPPDKSMFRTFATPLDETVIDKTIEKFLINWKVEILYDRNEYATMSQWLVRTFTFPSFESAIKFIQEGAIAFQELDHHPNLENSFKQVVVRTTTWNAGHRITQSDIDVALRLDQIATELLT